MSHRWHLAFHSGFSANSDLRAAVDAGVPIGVVAPLLSLAKVMLTLPRFLDASGHVFIDSGAYTAYQQKRDVDWERIFGKYESVISMTVRSQGLSIVAPDVIGDQDGTLKLWEHYAHRVKHCIRSSGDRSAATRVLECWRDAGTGEGDFRPRPILLRHSFELGSHGY